MGSRYTKNSPEPFIIVGTGIAGLLLAIELAERGCRSVLITKGRLEQSNTFYAQGGLAAVTGCNTNDSFDQHLLDTLMSGDGLTDIGVARAIVSDGGRLARRLLKLGVGFDFNSLALEGGHSLSRVVHCADATGRFIVESLIARATNNRLITILQNHYVLDIILEKGSARGVRVGSADNTNTVFDDTRDLYGRAVILATGGLGQVFGRTTNPATATGDGIATAFRAGACLADMEFVQFHPTALHLQGAPAFLISEAVRGAGAVLLDSKGRRFAHKYSARAELSTRDVVSRAIFWNMLEENSECVWLDMSPIGKDAIKQQFPNIVARLAQFGIDAQNELIPVSPAAHYFMGGILADELGRTSVPGLFAIGECASTGLHGANRLASNSLLEGGVMALKLSQYLIEPFNLNYASLYSSHPERGILPPAARQHVDAADFEHFQSDLLRCAGLVRSKKILAEFISRYAPSHASYKRMPAESEAESFSDSTYSTCLDSTCPGVKQRETESMFFLGKLIAASALLRCESRGAHWREDYPAKDDLNYRARLIHHRHGHAWLPLPVSNNETLSAHPVVAPQASVS